MLIKNLQIKTDRLSPWEKAKNLSEAVKREIKLGAKLADRDLRKRRGKICIKCEYWDKRGNLYLGECRKCGCSKFKRLFIGEQCPLNKW